MRIFHSIIYFFLLKFIGFVIYLRRDLFEFETFDVIQSVVPDGSIKIGDHKGSSEVTAFHLRKIHNIYELKLANGMILRAADEHKVFTPHGYLQKLQNLNRGDYVSTTTGSSRVEYCKKLRTKEITFDCTMNSEEHLFYTNDILSCNSIISAIFIVWYLLFNYERNVMCLSQNSDKVKELMDKIDTIIRNLPYFMKLGMVNDSVMTKIFDNGCKLVAQTTTENSGASYTIHLLYCDEFALIDESFLREFYRTVYPVISSSKISKMIITSTPRGMNKFYEIYTGAIKGENFFNPIRVDWFDVEGRGEEWKLEQIQQLGSEEDFNQEFGNQFVSGASLLFKSNVLKKIKSRQIKYVPVELEMLDDLEIEYKDCLSFHPKFNIENLKNTLCKFVLSIDLAEGGGGDYTVINFNQLMPMSEEEIEKLEIFAEPKDFFKLVQIGLLRCNDRDIPGIAKLLYHLLTKEMVMENVQILLELNHSGDWLIRELETIDGVNNEFESEVCIMSFNKDVFNPDSKINLGFIQSSKTKDASPKMIKDLVKNNRLVITEFLTVEESISTVKNKKGKYQSQTGNDDCLLTELNLTFAFDTTNFANMVDEIYPFISQPLKTAIDNKLGVMDNEEDEEDEYDLLEDL